jgi:hypothetical protein
VNIATRKPVDKKPFLGSNNSRLKQRANSVMESARSYQEILLRIVRKYVFVKLVQLGRLTMRRVEDSDIRARDNAKCHSGRRARHQRAVRT